MRSVAIIGAGQAGLILAIGLRQKGYCVSLYSNRTPEQIANGKIMSTQIYFETALRIEKKYSLNYWDSELPKTDLTESVVCSNTSSPPERLASYIGKTNEPFQGVDQRIKFPRWMKEFQNIGGHLIIEDVSLKRLEQISDENDLTIVCGGKSEICNLFVRDDQRSTVASPMRSLFALYVTGMEEPSSGSHMQLNVIKEVGEIMVMPGMTTSGLCNMIIFEGVPGGELDCFSNTSTPDELLKQAMLTMEKFVPWVSCRYKTLHLTDSNAILVGRFPPTVRCPTFQIGANGKYILGLGDSVVLNDPLGGQGGNAATKCADLYIEQIIARGDLQFDKNWMKETFEICWNKYLKWSTAWTHVNLTPPAELMQLVMAATKSQKVADFIVNCFDKPETICEWLSSSEKTEELIEQILKGSI